MTTSLKIKLVTVCVLCAAILTSGCTTIVDATTDGPIKTDPTKRSFGSIIDDQNLETIVAVNIKKATQGKPNVNINVHSFNGVILLIGQVPTTKTREIAGDTARNEPRVRQVYNELAVQPRTKFLDRTADAILRAKIKSKLLLNRDIDSSRVKVILEDDVAYLMGLLSLTQAEKITDVVRKVKGIKKVVRAIEYLD